MQVEIWKPIPDYEGLYEVSNLGRIRSLYNYRKYNVLTQNIKRGYYQIGLRKNGIRKWYQVHRLVAETFIPNPNNLPQVNHKNENKLDNEISNLEWCSVSYNNMYGSRLKRIKEKVVKPVYQYDLNGKFIKKHESLVDATKSMGLKSLSSISLCCSGKYKTSNGYKWSY